MSDIVERLRQCAEWHKGTNADCDEWLEAAETIEKLRAALKPFADMYENCWADIDYIPHTIIQCPSKSTEITVCDLRAAAAVLKETGE